MCRFICTSAASATSANYHNCNDSIADYHDDSIADYDDDMRAARAEAEAMAALWGALTTATTDERRQALIERHGAALVKSFNSYATLMRKLGLEGPYA